MTRGIEIDALAAGSALTVLVHVCVVVGLVAVSGHEAEAVVPEPEMLPVIDMELLRWGEEMPAENALPVIANPVPAPMRPEPPSPPQPNAEPAPTETVNLAEPSDAAPERDERPREQRPVEIERSNDAPVAAYRGPTNPNRPTNDAPIQGSPDGFHGGTSLSATAQRNLLARIQAQLQRAFRPPRSIPDDELRSLEIEVRIRVAPDGQVTGWRVRTPSGNALFDSSALATLNRFKVGRDRLDLSSITDDALRARIESDGFTVRMVGR